MSNNTDLQNEIVISINRCPDKIESYPLNDNPCEAMCLLWLRLNEKGFIR